MDPGYVVPARNAADEYRFQLEPAFVWLRLARWVPHLLRDGPRHGDQLVFPASLSSETGNDSRANISGDIALGNVARDRLDGRGRSHLPRAEVESNRQDFSRLEGEADRQRRCSDAISCRWLCCH